MKCFLTTSLLLRSAFSAVNYEGRSTQYRLSWLLVFLIPIQLSAQTVSDIELVRHTVPHHSKQDFRPFTGNNNSEYQLFFTGAFLFYKYCFSSQDAPNTCSFTPSCSEYALFSIKKKGVVLGIINTFDRLSRCTLLEEERYEMDPGTGKLSDYP